MVHACEEGKSFVFVKDATQIPLERLIITPSMDYAQSRHG